MTVSKIKSSRRVLCFLCAILISAVSVFLFTPRKKVTASAASVVSNYLFDGFDYTFLIGSSNTAVTDLSYVGFDYRDLPLPAFFRSRFAFYGAPRTHSNPTATFSAIPIPLTVFRNATDFPLFVLDSFSVIYNTSRTDGIILSTFSLPFSDYVNDFDYSQLPALLSGRQYHYIVRYKVQSSDLKFYATHIFFRYTSSFDVSKIYSVNVSFHRDLEYSLYSNAVLPYYKVTFYSSSDESLDNSASFCLMMPTSSTFANITTSYSDLDTTVYFSDSVDSSYRQGYNDGLSEGKTQGYDTGYAEASSQNQNFYDTGYSDGKSTGTIEGYNKGFSEGVESSNKYTFLSLFSAVIDAPIKAFTGLLDFNVLGYDMSSFFLSLMSVSLIIFVVKMVL